MFTIQSIGPPAADCPVFHVVGRSTRKGVTWLWARTDLDLATACAARVELDALLSAPEPPRFVLVYLGVECFVDVRGLRLLADATRRARSRGGDLVVVAPPHCLRRMTSRLGFTDHLSLASGAREAVQWTRVGRRV